MSTSQFSWEVSTEAQWPSCQACSYGLQEMGVFTIRLLQQQTFHMTIGGPEIMQQEAALNTGQHIKKLSKQKP